MSESYKVPCGGKSMSELSSLLKTKGFTTHLFDGEFKTFDTPCEDGSYYKWLTLHVESVKSKYDYAVAGDSIEVTDLGLVVHRVGETV